MAELQETGCCGIRELVDVVAADSARESVVDAAEDFHENDQDSAFIFYSVTSDSQRGHEIARYIAKYKLGTTHKTRSTLNPNSGNMLSMWVWTVNKRNFKNFWHKTRRYREEYKEDDYEGY